MPSSPAERAPRTGEDRCPGAVRLHTAVDGALARVRIPGGLLDVTQAEAVGSASNELGDGAIHLTSRGNVELRGLPLDAGPELADRLYAVGLLPSVAHERARNVVASPMSGLDGGGYFAGPTTAHSPGASAGVQDAQQCVRELDALLCADSWLTRLSGRFLFGFDDGRGDILSLSPDVTMVAVSPDDAEVILHGTSIGVRVPVAQATSAAIVAARAFVDGRATSSPDAWRIADLSTFDQLTLVADVRERLSAMAVGDDCEVSGVQTTETSQSSPTGNRGVDHESLAEARHSPPLGYVVGRDGSAALSVGVQLGRMSLTAWNTLIFTAIRGDHTLRLTPWRGVILPGFAADDATTALTTLSDHGLLTDTDSPWFGASACVGAPGCASALQDVRDHASRALVTEEMARDALATGSWATSPTGVPTSAPLLPVHWSGCERRCGHPVAPHIDVVASSSGYRIATPGQTPEHVANNEMAQSVSAAREVS